MQRLFRPLRTLQWQLSLSYILVVVVAIPILLGVGLVLVALTPSPSPAQQLVQLLTREVVPQVPHPLADAGQRARLNAWAVNFVLNQHPAKAGDEQNIPQLNAAETLATMIIDPTGHLVGSDPVMPPASTTCDPTSLAFFLQN